MPANAAVVVAGDVQVAQVKQWAEKYYGRIAAGALPAQKSPASRSPNAAGLGQGDAVVH